MGKRSRRDRGRSVPDSSARISSRRGRIVKMAAAAALGGAGLILAARSFMAPSGVNSSPNGSPNAFTRVGHNGSVYTVSVPRARVADDQYLIGIAERLSSEEAEAGGSGQVSVMVWPDDVPVPRDPPTTEFDGSMKTQAAGIFINPRRKIRHMIRFKDGATVSEKEFGEAIGKE